MATRLNTGYWNWLGEDEATSSGSKTQSTPVPKRFKATPEDAGSSRKKDKRETPDDSKHFEQEVGSLVEAVVRLEKKYESRYRSTMRTERIARHDLMRITMKAWFESHYRVPRNQEERKRAVYTSRGDLRERLNAYLTKIGLQEIGSKDSLWCEWFLGECIGLEQREKATGKAILLEERISRVQTKLSLQAIMDQIDEEQQREDEGDPMYDDVRALQASVAAN